MKNPLVSIIILTYKNGLNDIKQSLRSVNLMSYKPIEIILVDNASTENTVQYVKKYFPKVRIIENSNNQGFAKGNNQGVKISNGKYILLLNSDTVVTKNFLSKLVDDLENDKSIGVVQPKIRQLKDKDKLDACASFFTNTGFLYHYGYSQNYSDKKYNKKLFMYSAKGACFLTRKDLVERIGLFDEDYFAYFEETDFCHRVWLAGYKVLYEPTSEIFHLGGPDKDVSAAIQFHSYKNRISTYIKNFEFLTLAKILPLHVLLCILISLTYLLKGNVTYFTAIINAIIWNSINIYTIIKKRQIIQKQRIVQDTSILPEIKRSVKISYYVHFFFAPRYTYDFEEI